MGQTHGGRETDLAAPAPIVPPDHDRVVDLVRAVAILGVVVGHWLVDEFYISDGEIFERSNLASVPGMWPLTWLFMVLPLFFFVGGWSNKHSWESVKARGDGYAQFLSRRTHRLLTPTLLYVAVIFAVALLVRLLPELFAGRFTDQTAVLATQPLWFLGVYLLTTALTPLTLAAHRRWGWWVIVGLALVVVAVDFVTFAGARGAVSLLNVFAVWVLVHQLGYFDAQQRIGRSLAWAFAVGGYLTLAVLVGFGPYPARMVGIPGDEWSNTNPPNLAMLALALGQIGVVELARPALARLLDRDRLFLVVALVNSVIMSLYLWHQVAHMVAAAVLLPLGYPVPPPATTAWWLALLGMMAASAVVLAGIVVAVRPAEHRPPPREVPPQVWRTAVASASVVLAAAGLLLLAGTTVTRLADTAQVLGPVRASPLMGLLLILASVLGLRLVRSGHRGANQLDDAFLDSR